MLEDPKLFLRARRELEEEEPVAVRAAEELLRNLDVAGAIARRAMRQWREATNAMNLDLPVQGRMGILYLPTRNHRPSPECLSSTTVEFLGLSALRRDTGW